MIELEAVTKVYCRQRVEVRALDGIDLSIAAGELLVVRGPSGCGKTTLLFTLGGMLCPTSGRLRFEGRDLYAAPSGERARLRARRIGFVFQTFHLLPYLTVTDNVALAARDRSRAEAAADARARLEELGLAHRAGAFPAELSAGEQQRAAIARALINRPGLLLADEPTGNLDPDNARAVLQCLKSFHNAGGTVVLVTHDETTEIAPTRTVLLRRGRLVAS